MSDDRATRKDHLPFGYLETREFGSVPVELRRDGGGQEVLMPCADFRETARLDGIDVPPILGPSDLVDAAEYVAVIAELSIEDLS